MLLKQSTFTIAILREVLVAMDEWGTSFWDGNAGMLRAVVIFGLVCVTTMKFFSYIFPNWIDTS
jgi:hypothetical protein